jgi:hypothetical protein
MTWVAVAAVLLVGGAGVYFIVFKKPAKREYATPELVEAAPARRTPAIKTRG